MQLSRRMCALASLVTEGNRLADVGTDHGYIPIELVRSGRIPSAIAMDVNRGPLERAREHVREYGLDTYIETRLSDGLERLGAGEADTVLAAGMGGRLTRRILSAGTHCLSTVSELILQPQSEIHLVREWLIENDFRIETEDMVKEDGKYYPMMRAVHGKSRSLTPAQLHYGDAGCQRSLDVLEDYICAELQKNSLIRERLAANGQEDSERMRELLEERGWLMTTAHDIERMKRQDKEQSDEMQ